MIEFFNLHKLLDDKETISDLVSCIESIGIWSKDRYGRDLRISVNSDPKEIEKIKKALLYYDGILRTDLSNDGTSEEVRFAIKWEKLNSQDNPQNVYIKNGWYGREFFDCKQNLVSSREMLRESVDVNTQGRSRENRQPQREGVLKEWLEKGKHNVETRLSITRHDLWNELSQINSSLFREVSKSTMKKFFDNQKLCRTKMGRRKIG